MFKLFKFIINSIAGILVLGIPEGDENIVKFGGIEIDTTGFSEEQITNLSKAKDSYVASGQEAAKVNLYKEKAEKFDNLQKNPDVKTKVDPKDIDAIVEAKIKERMGKFDEVSNTMMAHNINTQMDIVKTKITTDYANLGKEVVAEVIKGADELFKGLPLDQKNPKSYENYIKANLAEKANANLGNLQSDRAKAIVKGDPKILKSLFDEYIAENKLDINMGFEGITSNEEFTTRMTTLQGEFKKAKTTQDRVAIATKINNLDSQGSKFGFKIS